MTVALVAVCCSPQKSYAVDEGVGSSVVKAAFLYNFAKFTEWPADSIAPAGSLIACSNDPAVADALSQLSKDHDVNGRTLEVRRISADSVQLRGCHMLYLCNVNAAQSLRLIDALDGAAVLTVGDFNRFAALGGIVQFVAENGRLRFAINLTAMGRQRLRLSSRLLALASFVEDERHGR